MILFYATIEPMSAKAQPQLSISEFKATCLSVIEEVRRTGHSVVVTRFGVPVAEINPPPPPEKSGKWVGRMVGTGKILGDIVAPATESSDWDAMR